MKIEIININTEISKQWETPIIIEEQVDLTYGGIAPGRSETSLGTIENNPLQPSGS